MTNKLPWIACAVLLILLIGTIIYASTLPCKEPICLVSNAKPNVDLHKCDFAFKNLSNLDMSEANLTYARFFNANLSGSNFEGANLEEAYLRGADLSEANLDGTILIYADISLADFSDAENLTKKQILSACIKRESDGTLSFPTLPNELSSIQSKIPVCK